MMRDDGIRPFAFVFPGQGSQRAGMLEAIPETEDIDRLLDAAEALSGLELRTIAALGGDEELADTRVAQPLLYLADWAWGNALIDAGLSPDAVAGHSLGEFAALAIAEVFSVEAGLELVVERSRLMATAAAAAQGGMVAVLGMEPALVGELVSGMSGVWLANDNGPGQVIISGTHQGLEKATHDLTAAGARKLVPLRVAGPFHSPLMEPAREAFAAILDETEFSPALVPIVQNTDPAPTIDPDLIKARLALQITAPVRWTETMYALRDLGIEVLVEAGPGAVLKGLARKVEGLEAAAVEDAGIETIAEEIL
jgi:[acyl-carrier-protein] S-malonyltransferase